MYGRKFNIDFPFLEKNDFFRKFLIDPETLDRNLNKGSLSFLFLLYFLHFVKIANLLFS